MCTLDSSHTPNSPRTQLSTYTQLLTYIQLQYTPIPTYTQAYMTKLGYKPSDGPGFLTPKPPFWERPTFVLVTAAAPNPAAEEARFAGYSKDYASLKRKYDISRNTVTRTGVYVVRGDGSTHGAAACGRFINHASPAQITRWTLSTITPSLPMYAVVVSSFCCSVHPRHQDSITNPPHTNPPQSHSWAPRLTHLDTCTASHWMCPPNSKYSHTELGRDNWGDGVEE